MNLDEVNKLKNKNAYRTKTLFTILLSVCLGHAFIGMTVKIILSLPRFAYFQVY